ncbi:MAG: methyl-accepting chemotaxis protein [Phenylobacterium sp.]|jgi:methyl-accepting chemotaxis protein
MAAEKNSIQVFIVAANISAILAVAQQEAKKLSLTAKNARAIAIRAGEKAMGFKVITDFIDEFANLTIECANEINDLSLHFAQVAMNSSNYKEFLNQLDTVKSNGTDISGPVFDQLYSKTEDLVRGFDSECQQLVRNLESLLETIQTQMRASGFIAATSKVEAARAEEYKDNLDSVAENIAVASGTIMNCVNKSFHWLREY